METSDDLLFSKESPLLPAAAELAFHTVNCSALNAEELRRENGLEVIGTGLRLILRHIKWFLTVQNLRTDALGTAFSFPLFHQIAHFLAGVRVLSSEVVGNVTYKVVPGNALKKNQYTMQPFVYLFM